MEYEWERRAKIAYRRGKLPANFRIMAVAVENTDTGEAALLMLSEPDGSVNDADCWQDVMFDAGRHYGMSREMMAVAFADRATQGSKSDG